MTNDNCPQCDVLWTALASLLREIDQQAREGLQWPRPDFIDVPLRNARSAVMANPYGTTELNG